MASCTVTSAAASSTGVRHPVIMSAPTYLLAVVPPWGASHVLFMNYWLKVVRVDTRSVATEVVELESIRDRAVNDQIAGTMRQYDDVADGDNTVALTMLCSCPFPAGALVDLGEESLDLCWRSRIHNLPTECIAGLLGRQACGDARAFLAAPSCRQAHKTLVLPPSNDVEIVAL